MNKKTKIALVIPSLHAGGMERVMSKIASYLSDVKNTEVHLVMYGKKPALFFQIDEKVTIHLPKFSFKESMRFISTIRRLLYLRKTVQQLKPDSLLSFGEYWNNFVLLALVGLKVPVFVSDRCQPNKSLGKLHDLLRKLIYPRAKGVIVQTNIAKSIYKKMLPSVRIHVIGNPIELSTKKMETVKDNIVLTVGRLIESKHHDELIKMFIELDIPEWKLVIVGGDALKQNNSIKLQKLINELNVSDKVILTGNTLDVDTYYQRAKIFAFTSSSEGFPNVIVEALSAGLPVIAYDCVAGPAEIIQDNKNGFLVPLFDKATFKKKLRLLMENEDVRLRLSEKAQSSIENFSLEKIGNIYLETILS